MDPRLGRRTTTTASRPGCRRIRRTCLSESQLQALITFLLTQTGELTSADDHDVPVYRPKGGLNRLLGWADDFMSWMLFGHETWLVAVLKGVPLFLFLYFVVFYIPNYVYYLVTVEIPFLRFSEDVGFLIANGVGMTTFAS